MNPALLVLGGYALLALWVLFRPRAESRPERPSPLTDLRLWALLALACQIFLYGWLG